MLSKVIKYSFSQLTPKFNPLGALNKIKNTLKAPIKHIKRAIEPTGVNASTMTNTTEEAFDEVAHEWQTFAIGNPFDLQVFNYLENAQSSNFGTVDNPLVIFSSEVPFRYVGCTGQMNEDDYEGHELLYFMLREGPLQRCPQCGQVFKLVRLRNEYTPEMDYYAANFHTYDMIEMGEADTTILMSVFKYGSHHEYTDFETPSNMVYQLVNPDEHDRLLIDPAYRLERAKIAEEKVKVYWQTLQYIDQQYTEQYGPPAKYPMNKVDYETLVDIEKAVMKLDRNFRKVSRFQNRRFVDRVNHDRREARMIQRKKERWDNNYAFFDNNMTEEEQQYLDYFETDVEAYPEIEQIEENLDQMEILSRPDYQFEKYDFQERYTRNPEDDQTSFISKIVFDFKYRQAKDSSENFTRRNDRMVERQQLRAQTNQISSKIKQVSDANLVYNNRKQEVEQQSELLEQLINESKLQIKDYFESDAEKMGLQVLDNVSQEEKATLLSCVENHTTRGQYSQGGYTTIPKRAFDSQVGFWANFYADIQEIQQIQPQAHKMANQGQYQKKQQLTADELKEAGLLE